MNHKNEKTKQKPASWKLVFFMLLCGVFAVSAQGDWRIESVKKYETGKTDIFEKNSQGLTRTTYLTLFPDQETAEIELVEVKKDDEIISRTLSRFNKAERRIFYSKEEFDSDGKITIGERWTFKLDDNGDIFQPETKIDEKYNPETGQWIILQTSDASHENKKNKEIHSIGWETGLDYFLHFNEAVKEKYFNFKPITLSCSPNPEKQYPTSGVYGGPAEYHNWSTPCASAVHSGKITFESGGVITIQYVTYSDPSKQPKLVGSTRNGITSVEHEDWTSARFRFVN